MHNDAAACCAHSVTTGQKLSHCVRPMIGETDSPACGSPPRFPSLIERSANKPSAMYSPFDLEAGGHHCDDVTDDDPDFDAAHGRASGGGGHVYDGILTAIASLCACFALLTVVLMHPVSPLLEIRVRNGDGDVYGAPAPPTSAHSHHAHATHHHHTHNRLNLATSSGGGFFSSPFAGASSIRSTSTTRPGQSTIIEAKDGRGESEYIMTTFSSPSTDVAASLSGTDKVDNASCLLKIDDVW